MESVGVEGAKWLKLVIELASVVAVGIGFVSVIYVVVRGRFQGSAIGFNAVRLNLARYLSIALELQLGADIIGTAISPTWEQIAELAAIAVIRTALNFFLNREMAEEAVLIREEADALPSPPVVVTSPPSA